MPPSSSSTSSASRSTPPPPSPAPTPTAPASLHLLATGGALGDTDPCGCKVHPRGGLARRKAWIDGVRASIGSEAAARVAVLDAGGSILPAPAVDARPSPRDQALAALQLQAMAAMGYAALNVGLHELALGRERLVAVAAANGVPLVSSCLLDAESGRPAFAPLRMITLAGVKVAVGGVIAAPDEAQRAALAEMKLRALAPVDAARAVVKVARAQGAALIVVLSQLHELEVEAVGAVEGVDLVIGSAERAPREALEGVGHALLVDPGERGKFVADLELVAGEPGAGWAAADRSASLRAERARLDSERERAQRQLDATRADDVAAREALTQLVVRLRARVAAIELDLEDGAAVDPRAGRVSLRLVPIEREMPVDAQLRAVIDAFVDRYGAKPVL